MPEVKLQLKVRIDELPTVAGFLNDSFTRDFRDFTDYSPDFNDHYLGDLTTKISAVNALVNPKQLTAEEKLITQRIGTNMFKLPDLMSKLEGYVKRAVGLTVLPADFGIKQVRKAYKKDDQEGLDGAIDYLLGNINANMEALVAKGYSTEKKALLITAHNAINADNLAQNAKQNERSTLVENNYGTLNALWSTLMDICDTGKRIYKVVQVSKKDDYTMAALKRRIRQEQKKTKITGTVTAAGAPVKGAKVVVKPAGGGRSKSTKTKADGSYEVKDLVATDMLVTATATGYAPKVESATVVSNATEVVNFALV